MIDDLFSDLDAQWNLSAASKIRLRIIGSTALMLQSDYSRGTKDSDLLETTELSGEIQGELRRLAGRGTALHQRHRLYVDVVGASIPFLPRAPKCHRLSRLSESLDHFEIEILDVVDVVVSKLKRFNANDVSDIEAMVLRDLVPHAVLVDRFRDAVDSYEMDARAEDLPRYVANLHVVERDLLVAQETTIVLPEWLDE